MALMAERFGERAFTTFEAARLCGVFHTTVINWVNKGKLKARTTPGGHRRIPLSELLAFMRRYEMPVPADIADADKRVLVLDDEPMVAKVIQKALTRLKDRCSVETAANPVEALVSVGKRLPDLLVMDLMMPVMDGFQVLRILKSSPLTKDVKILAISGRKLPPLQQEFVERSVDGFLAKPFELPALVAAVDRILAEEPARLTHEPPARPHAALR